MLTLLYTCCLCLARTQHVCEINRIPYHTILRISNSNFDVYILGPLCIIVRVPFPSEVNFLGML